MNIHKTAIGSGVKLAPSYEFNGNTEPAIYTMTLAQLESIVGKVATRLLTALDGMDRGCTQPGFKGHQNGYGEDAALQ